MSPRWAEVAGFLIAASLLTLTTPAFAKIDRAAAMLAPAPPPSKSCSGAFRYAARVGNTDIVEVSPVQAFARDRRASYAHRATPRARCVGLGAEHRSLACMSSIARCAGTR